MLHVMDMITQTIGMHRYKCAAQRPKQYKYTRSLLSCPLGAMLLWPSSLQKGVGSVGSWAAMCVGLAPDSTAFTVESIFNSPSKYAMHERSTLGDECCIASGGPPCMQLQVMTHSVLVFTQAH